MSAQNSAGIQTLLDAERDSQKIITKAREYRLKRVKEARDEATKEIEAYKKAKDEKFIKFESEHTICNKKAEEEANILAEKKIIEIHEAGKKGEEKVVADLLNAVVEFTPAIPV